MILPVLNIDKAWANLGLLLFHPKCSILKTSFWELRVGCPRPKSGKRFLWSKKGLGNTLNYPHPLSIAFNRINTCLKCDQKQLDITRVTPDSKWYIITFTMSFHKFEKGHSLLSKKKITGDYVKKHAVKLLEPPTMIRGNRMSRIKVRKAEVIMHYSHNKIYLVYQPYS